MKRKIESLIGFTIGATDGEIGKVEDFYFDDETWTIRYLIVETGNWLVGRKILLSPQSLLTPDWDNKIFPVNLSKDQIKSSPEIDTNRPVSRQHERNLYGHYPWGTYYWGSAMDTGMSYPIGIPPDAQNNDEAAAPGESETDTHLRSTNTITGYAIKASDGDIGEVEDFIVNDLTWAVGFIEVDTGNWLPGKKVLISPKWIKQMNWKNASVIVKLTEEQVKNSPEYVPNKAVTDDYEANLQTYYGGFFTHK